MAKVQIDESLFLDLFKYFFLEEPSEELYQKCKTQINDKLDSIVKRQIYTKYKTAATEQEREQARQEYLDRIGMREDFRY